MTISVRERTVRRTFTARLHIAGKGPLPELNRQCLTAAVTIASVAVQRVLSQLQAVMHIQQNDDNQLISVELVVPCCANDEARARRNVAKPRRLPPTDKGPKEQARPQYRNSYHLEEVSMVTGSLRLRFRVAEAFRWLGTTGRLKGKWLRDLHLIDAKILQQVINSWLKPDLTAVPATLRPGVCQQAAQQFLSHIGLLNEASQTVTSYPSLEERDPIRREREWKDALDRLIQSVTPFAYAKVRELYPGEYADDDPRGDRLVNIDPDWLAFIRSPFPGTLPLNFVTSDAVVIYERTWIGNTRLYAALPLLQGVTEHSLLHRLGQKPKLRWWHCHLHEFQPLPAWSNASLTTARGQPKELLLIPLEYDPGKRSGRPSRFRSAFTGQGSRWVNWSLLTQSRMRRGTGRGQTQWQLHFVTSRSVAPTPRPYVLGIHFGLDPILWWALSDCAGQVLQEGHIAGNEIMSAGLQSKMRLEEAQGQQRWVGDRRYNEELQRRTYEIGHLIINQAAALHANLAVEEIAWVDKRSGPPEANRRFSLWNFSQLSTVVEWLGLERQVDGRADPVLTLRRVNDYILRYTCPQCGACRQAKQTAANATTWREGATLHCRPCGFSGPVSDDHQARLVARLGAERLQ